jgi:hypothetical protein
MSRLSNIRVSGRILRIVPLEDSEEMDVDGEPMIDEDEDVDGEPMDDDVDGEPMEEDVDGGL